MSQNDAFNKQIPDPEVEPKAVRRHHTRIYKQHILEEIEVAREPGEIGPILRLEGLYSQIISKWRSQWQRWHLGDTDSSKRGPPSLSYVPEK